MNRILYADDCLNVLNDADQLPDESVDLIYLDPPFNSSSTYNLPFKGKDKAAEPVAAFTDVWSWRSGDDDARLRKLHADPRSRSLASIIQFARDAELEQMYGGGKIESRFVFAEYGPAPAGNAARSETDRQHLPPL